MTETFPENIRPVEKDFDWLIWVVYPLSCNTKFYLQLEATWIIEEPVNLRGKMCLSVLRREFRLVQLGLIYPDAADFVQSPVSFILLYTCEFDEIWKIFTLVIMLRWNGSYVR